MNLFDTTLRDGGNVVGDGFNEELTVSILEGLLNAGIQDIELGNCKGLGAYELAGATQALTDEQYLQIIQPYLQQGRLGMFQGAGRARETNIRMAKEYGLHFLRVGANAGDGKKAVKAVEMVKNTDMVCRYSLMKAYVLSPLELAQEAKMLQSSGVDKITIMDSAGTMFPQEAADYVKALKDAVTISVGFHGHSNLGLSQANALSAVAAGADEIDCGLLGMARSAGNCTTELAVAALQKEGLLSEVDLYQLLDYLETKLIPAMEMYHYYTPVKPVDLVLGLTGCHSSYLPALKRIANQENVSLFKLMAAVSSKDRKSPNEELMIEQASRLKT